MVYFRVTCNQHQTKPLGLSLFDEFSNNFQLNLGLIEFSYASLYIALVSVCQQRKVVRQVKISPAKKFIGIACAEKERRINWAEDSSFARENGEGMRMSRTHVPQTGKTAGKAKNGLSFVWTTNLCCIVWWHIFFPGGYFDDPKVLSCGSITVLSKYWLLNYEL